MKKYIFLFSLCICTILSTAQETSRNKYTHQLGLNFGGVTGLGPSYRYWPGKLGLQVTFLPIKVEENWQDPLHIKEFYQAFFPVDNFQTFISGGLGCFYTLKQAPKYILLTYIGNHLLIRKNDEIYNAGAGFGISFNTKISFSLLLGYAAYDIIGSPISFPTAEIGIHFGFTQN
jgi:hypothetical protein